MYGQVGADLDETEVSLEKSFFCDKCKKKMILVGNNKYKCPSCGNEYNDS